MGRILFFVVFSLSAVLFSPATMSFPSLIGYKFIVPADNEIGYLVFFHEFSVFILNVFTAWLEYLTLSIAVPLFVALHDTSLGAELIQAAAKD
jgi:hypothetical protein